MTGRRSKTLGERIAARANAPVGAPPVPTDEDRRNLQEFRENLQKTSDLLASEIEAINQGNLEIIAEFYEQKTRLLKWLEMKLPVIEPFTEQAQDDDLNLREDLINLRKLARENSELLSRMSTAARSVIREIKKTTDRNSLSGLYGQSGKKLEDASGGEVHLNREI